VNVYSNCYYACRFCNARRHKRPVESDGATLLDPCKDPWAEHFIARGLGLVPRDGDADAGYTEQVYRLNDDLRMELRRQRRVLHDEDLPLLSRVLEVVMKLVSCYGSVGDRSLLDEAKKLFEEDVRRRWARLRPRLAPIPRDAPARPGCEIEDHNQLPAGLVRQLLHVHLI
jgi:hypothetical protein